ncbi:hypothetical protein HMPREF1866_00740 [Lachnoanaerobaculum saburreum]|uniref:Uncharacterized protein n=1 Tax=Lachnoanaerobaculum saburreum TaxID=467210 RepID=A0A133ZXB8_9FIRM|nr:hypothetical protein HMPREF9099_02951 [Lachnospiraceae bacterium oral taxon 082 str. F0431]KXB60083.1 hypothetical protein HMPREF1866_00740 [Lachnoanaerobaculum saburreum]
MQIYMVKPYVGLKLIFTYSATIVTYFLYLCIKIYIISHCRLKQ